MKRDGEDFGNVTYERFKHDSSNFQLEVYIEQKHC